MNTSRNDFPNPEEGACSPSDNEVNFVTAVYQPATSQTPVTDQTCPEETHRKEFVESEKDVRIQQLEEELQRVKQELQVEKNKQLHNQQTHQLAIIAKRKENERLEKCKEVQDEQLRHRIRELESKVEEQNADLHDKHTRRRDYDALLRRLSITEAEKNAFQDDRQRLHLESNGLQEQINQLTTQNDNLRSRIHDLNKSLTTVLYESKHQYEGKIKTLENEVDILKARPQYEHEFVANQSADRSLYEIQQVRSNATYSNFTGSLFANNSSSYSSNSNSMCSVAKGSCSEGFSEKGLPQPKRKKLFLTEPSKVPRCGNCMVLFDRIHPGDIECRFHRAPPQPYQVWKHVLDSSKYIPDGSNQTSLKFWPCCEKLERREPAGCMRLPRHEIVHPL